MISEREMLRLYQWRRDREQRHATIGAWFNGAAAMWLLFVTVYLLNEVGRASDGACAAAASCYFLWQLTIDLRKLGAPWV